MSNLQPYDITKLVEGAVRVLYAPTTQAIPTDITGVHAMVSPYTKAGSWVDFGAAKSAANYNRGITKSGLDIQQETSEILTSVSDISRTAQFSIAEIAEDNIKIIEQAPAINTIAAAAGRGAQKSVPAGGFTELTRYRIALVGVRHKDSGLVTEPGGATRGRLVACVLYRAELTGDNVQVSQEKGNLWEAQVTFEAFPEPGQPSGQDYMAWFFEQAGTIT
jgi:hypothetical protein